MKIPKILIVGATGKLGSMILNFTFKNNIPIFAITCFDNVKKLNSFKNKYDIKNTFCLNNKFDKEKFLFFCKSKRFDIIYFLDVGSSSLFYLSHFLKYQNNSDICIANKEMIIAGGSELRKSILVKGCNFIPLDSEHFSLINHNFDSNNIKRIQITASGGPFYFDKKMNLNKVTKKQVLSHPKWKMGLNNLIDSSNFVNKVLEILELSYIYDIPLKKIDFVVSREAFIHSIIYYKDETISINCFSNNMLITLTKPLKKFYDFNLNISSNDIYDLKKFSIEKFNDKRFQIYKYINSIKSFNHNQQILFMILNNKAQKLYLDGLLPYNKILIYIFNKIKLFNNYKSKKLTNFKDILKFIDNIKFIIDDRI